MKKQSAPSGEFKGALKQKLSNEYTSSYASGHAFRFATAGIASLVVIFGFGGGTFAAYASPAVSEGHPLNFLKAGVENVEEWVAERSPEAKARFHARMAERRLDEAEHPRVDEERRAALIERAAEELELTEAEVLERLEDPESRSVLFEELGIEPKRFNEMSDRVQAHHAYLKAAFRNLDEETQDVIISIKEELGENDDLNPQERAEAFKAAIEAAGIELPELPRKHPALDFTEEQRDALKAIKSELSSQDLSREEFGEAFRAAASEAGIELPEPREFERREPFLSDEEKELLEPIREELQANEDLTHEERREALETAAADLGIELPPRPEPLDEETREQLDQIREELGENEDLSDEERREAFEAAVEEAGLELPPRRPGEEGRPGGQRPPGRQAQ